MKHVLLIGNIDGHSIQLLRYAGKLCNDLKLRLHVLQVEPDNNPVLLSSPYYFNKLGYTVPNDISDKRKKLESFLLQNTKELIDATWVSSKLVRGNIEQCLDTFINEEKIDLVIARQVLFKRNDLEENELFKKIFLNIVKIPVLLVPENNSYKQFKKLAYFLTFKKDDFTNISWLLNNFSSSKIEMLHFSEKEDSVEQQKWAQYLLSEIKTKRLTYHKKPQKINDFIEKESSTTAPEYHGLCLTTRKRSFWERLIDPSTTLNLITQIETPVFIFKYEVEKE